MDNVARGNVSAVLATWLYLECTIMDPDRVRELLDQEDAAQQRRVLASYESFKDWLSFIGILIDVAYGLYDLYMWLRRTFR